MLVLTRELNQTLVVSNAQGIVLTIKVTELRGDKVRLGIQAPKSLSIDREEVYREKLKAKQSKDDGSDDCPSVMA